MAMPHLGGWEWSGFWVTQVQSDPVTAVVERLEPPALFEWFVELRRSFGFEIVPSGPRPAPPRSARSRPNHTLALLCDRDLAGTGPEVEFFGERTTLPGGPATLALRTGAPLLPTAVYFDGPDLRRSVVLPRPRHHPAGQLRDDVAAGHPGPRPRARGPDPPRPGAVAPPAAELAQRPPVAQA